VTPKFYHCFGCGASGDVISWLQSQPGGNYTFMESVKFAAGMAGLKLDDKIDEQITRLAEERDKRQEALDYYRTKLDGSDEAREYLLGRGLTQETIDHFRLGYAPSLPNGQWSDIRPPWAGIAIPIFGKSGNLDAISFRAIDPENKQRYYHKNNDMWAKGQALYNAQVIEFGDGPIYICEGMFDVMSMWQNGFRRSVAVMTGTLNDHQIKDMGENPVVFVPDRDKENDFDLFKKSVFRLRNNYPNLVIKVAILPDGDANSADPAILKAAIESAESAELSILRADLDKCLDIDTEYKTARKVATDINDPLTKDDIVRWLAERWGKDREVVKQALTRSDSPIQKSLTIGDALDDLVKRENSVSLKGVALSCLGVQKFISRPHTSQVALIAARANVGKTMMALNMIHAGREFGIPSLFLSMEQPASELAFRLCLMASSDLTPMNGDTLSQHIKANSEEWSQGLRHLVEFSYPNLRFREDRLTPQGVKDAIIDASYAIGQKVQIVYIDYLGLMGHDMRSNDSYERMGAIGRDIQAITKEMDVFGIYLMQLSRKGGSGTERVSMDMLRDSGVLEEVADYIIGAWREDDGKAKETEEAGIRKVFVNVCKNRHGDRGDAELWMDTSTLLLMNTDHRHADYKPPRRDEGRYDEDGVYYMPENSPVDPFDG